MKRLNPLSRHKVMQHGIEAFDQVVKEPERLPQAAGTIAGLSTPVLAVTATAELTGLAGGAAIMKTLAIAGATVGGGALVGIVVLGVGAVGVGWGVTKLVKKLRSRDRG